MNLLTVYHKIIQALVIILCIIQVDNIISIHHTQDSVSVLSNLDSICDGR